MPANVQVVQDHTAEVIKAIRDLSRKEILIGVPESKATRQGEPISNAVIGYIHEFGAPKQNIPARPFLRPTITEMKPTIIEAMRKASDEAIAGRPRRMLSIMNSLGLRAVSEVKKRIASKIAPPLAAATIAKRLARTKAGQKRLHALHGSGTDLKSWGWSNLTPLIDTSNFLGSISYVIRNRK